MLSKPEFDWECRGFKVNEGPAVLVHGDKLFISYSASATDENYCMGLLWIDLQADPLQPTNWHKAPQPVFRTSYENRQYGPGHNSFTQTPAGEDVLVYHARNYTEIEGDPLYDPNRHTRLKTRQLEGGRDARLRHPCRRTGCSGSNAARRRGVPRRPGQAVSRHPATRVPAGACIVAG